MSSTSHLTPQQAFSLTPSPLQPPRDSQKPRIRTMPSKASSAHISRFSAALAKVRSSVSPTSRISPASLNLDRLTTAQRNEVVLALKDHINPDVFLNRRLTAAQMRQVRLGCISKVDVSMYNNPGFSHRQMEVIRTGLEKELPVWVYANPHLSTDRMKKAATLLAKDIDPQMVSRFTVPQLSEEQAYEVYRGLLDGVDISVYASVNLTAREMRSIRTQLAKNTH